MVDQGLTFDFTLPGDLRFLFYRLANRGLEAWLVGPAVRDVLMDRTLDRTGRVDLLVSGGTLRDLEDVLTGAAGDRLFIPPPQRLRRALAFELRDGEGATVRRVHAALLDPEGGLPAELAEREVTVNAMAMDLRGRLVDPFGGAADLAAGLLRPLGSLDRIFRERPLNILKVAKNAAFHRLEPSPEVLAAATRDTDRLLDLPPSGWRPEFERMLLNRFPDLGFRFLERCGALRFLVPELQLLVGFEQSCPVHHKDIYAHTLAVIRQAKPVPSVRWAALIHDLGKYWTRSVARDGEVHFFRHEEVSALLGTGILARFGVEARLAERVDFLVRAHSRITLYSDEWTESAIRRLIKETDPHLADLLALARADITSRREDRVEEVKRLSRELEERIEEVRQKDAYVPPLAKGFGQLIIDHFGLEPGPVVGQLKRRLEEAIDAGRLPRDQPPEAYLEFLAGEIRRSAPDAPP
ncbi:MAG: HD domain-containing protein [Deltaproteobacteria bacterium]|nr:HD domain-containing protein [Deltaproteobacteria bacterium]